MGNSFITILEPGFWGIYGTSESSIYFSSQGNITYYNGHTFAIYWFLGDSMPDLGGTTFRAIWVTPNGQNIWAAGDSGIVVHRDPSGKWTQMQSPTTFPIESLCGFSNSRIYASAGYSSIEGGLYFYDGTKWSTVFQSVYPDSSIKVYAAYDVYGTSPDSLLTVGNGIYSNFTGSWQNRNTPLQQGYGAGVFSQNGYNYFVCGDYSTLIKWDGIRYVSYNNLIPSSIGSWNRVIMVGNDIFVVGGDTNFDAYLVHGQ